MTAANLRPAGSEEAAGRPGLRYRRGLLVARRRRVVWVVWLLLLAAGLAFVPKFSSGP